MPQIYEWSIDEYEYAHHAASVEQQIVEFLIGGQCRIQKDVIEQMPGDLGHKQGDYKLNNPSDRSNDQILCVRPDIYEKADKIPIFRTHKSISTIFKQLIFTTVCCFEFIRIYKKQVLYIILSNF